jgi:hypothetical protein
MYLLKEILFNGTLRLKLYILILKYLITILYDYNLMIIFNEPKLYKSIENNIIHQTKKRFN